MKHIEIESKNRLLFLNFSSTTYLIAHLLLGSLAFGQLNTLSARSLDWGGSVHAVNLESDLTTPLDASYVFYLGYFKDFTPTSVNISEWSEHWKTIDAVNYNTQFSVFNARHEITSSDPTGKKGYIWGVRRTRESMEWILITDPSWTWPGNGVLDQKVNWLVGSASESIVGYINGSGYQMITAPVADATPIPVISYDLWVKRFFADTDTNAAPDADPNGNNLGNLAEFALDVDPVKPTVGAAFGAKSYKSPSEQSLPEAEQGRCLGVILQPSMDADVQILGWVSPDLNFAENVTPAIIETLSDGTLLIRDSVPIGNGSRQKFLKLEFREPS